MLEKATAQKELFVSRGMSPMLLDAIAGALGEFEQTLEASREGRRNHVGSAGHAPDPCLPKLHIPSRELSSPTHGRELLFRNRPATK
jgi:hypothetical protein